MCIPPVFIAGRFQKKDTNTAAVNPERNGLDLACLPLTSHSYQQRLLHKFPWLHHATTEYPGPDLDLQEAAPPPFNEECIVSHNTRCASVVFASSWVELDARDSRYAQTSFEVLCHELEIASKLGAHTVVIPGPKRRSCIAQYGRFVQNLLMRFPETNIGLSTVVCETGARLPGEASKNELQPPSQSCAVNYFSTWHAWHCVRVICEYSPRLSVVLRLTGQSAPLKIYDRWLCEPVTAVIVPVYSNFAPSKGGHQVLRKACKQFLQQLARRPLIAVLDKFDDGFAPLSYYAKYLRRLFARRDLTAKDILCIQYLDVLQEPLKPLSQLFSSEIYASLECDQTKYNAYQNAIEQAFSEELANVQSPRVVVGGAGRGPLVSIVLAVAEKLGRQATVWAVEHNPVALAALSEQQNSAWQSQDVILVDADVRDWVAPEPVNLIVSELLGSFGDNELDPECMGAFVAKQQRDIACVTIPQSYSSWIAPITAPILWGGLKNTMSSLESPFVAAITEEMVLCEPQQTWVYQHSYLKQPPLSRSSKVSFETTQLSILHGFAGFFVAELYGGVTLSTLPKTATMNLVSWFPMYFPIAQPIMLQATDTITMQIWRTNDSKRVWYEWMAIKGKMADLEVSQIYNSFGSSWSTSLFKRDDAVSSAET